MSFQQPLVFKPIFMERVWGGRRIATTLGKQLPPDESVVATGSLAGATLHDLWTKMREPIFGANLPDTPQFPLLAKILDARETLSVQVHPPAHKAAELNGEPKTEMWYLLDASPDAELFAGFRRGTTRGDFERALREGRVAELLHRIPVKAGDAIFIPSGRCHAIGAGCLIVEIQQNSDTTYRVFDWNRTGLDRKPRALHVAESRASIDFNDHEPALAQPDGEVVVSCPEFLVEHWKLQTPRTDFSANGVIFTVLAGGLTCGGSHFKTGEFFILPAATKDRVLCPTTPKASILRTTIP